MYWRSTKKPKRSSCQTLDPSSLAIYDDDAPSQFVHPQTAEAQQKRRQLNKRIVAMIVVGLTLFLGAIVGGVLSATRKTLYRTPPPPLPTNLTVGAYYYPWHGGDFHSGGGYLRKKLDPFQEPLLGEYDDRDPGVISQHLEWSRQANIGLWVCSWWGPYRREDETLRNNILPHPELFDHKIALFWESKGRLKHAVRDLATAVESDILFMCREYFSHPNYYRIDGRPVLFIYLSRVLEDMDLLEEVTAAMRNTTSMLCENGESIYLVGDHAFSLPRPRELDLLDAVTNYDGYGSLRAAGHVPYATQEGVDEYYDDQEEWQVMASQHDCAFIPCVSPGFNDRGVRLHVDHPPLSRKLEGKKDEFGTFFSASLARAVYQVEEATGNLLMVNSFNEWHEDSQIEPVKYTEEPTKEFKDMTEGVEYEGYGDLYLRILFNWTFDEEAAVPSTAPSEPPSGLPTSSEMPSSPFN